MHKTREFELGIHTCTRNRSWSITLHWPIVNKSWSQSCHLAEESQQFEPHWTLFVNFWTTIKFVMYPHCFSFSLSLSHTHTHTHKHTLLLLHPLPCPSLLPFLSLSLSIINRAHGHRQNTTLVNKQQLWDSLLEHLIIVNPFSSANCGQLLWLENMLPHQLAATLLQLQRPQSMTHSRGVAIFITTTPLPLVTNWG